MKHVYEYLKDVTDHTLSLGKIELVRVNGTSTETQVDAMAEDRSVLLLAKTHKAIPEFVGQFGMPNLTKLNIILNIPEYKEDAKITVSTQEKGEPSVTVPTGLHFENKTGDFKNDYRFMSAELINTQMKTIKARKELKWDVEFAPQVQNIQRFRFMASANSEETTFIAKTEKGTLKFYFGDHSSHAGNFVFADGITGNITKTYHWPIAVVQSILNLSGDKMFRFSDEGAAQITVDSGLGTYIYTLPAMQK